MSAGRPRFSARARLAVVGLVGAGVLGAFAVSGLQDNMVYYRTPTELGSDTSGRIRLGGLVQQGSLVREGGDLHFTVTDGVAAIPVVYRGATTGVFREGQGAIVEGILDTGVFHADSLLVKHDNSYVSEDGQSYKARK